MTDHKPMPVHGYTSQSEAKIHLVNALKQLEEMVLRDLDALKLNEGIDQRWLAIGRTDIEKGFMAVNRSIFQPGRVTLPEDGGLQPFSVGTPNIKE